jgi:chemotaxis protein histidine kinase CheA
MVEDMVEDLELVKDLIQELTEQLCEIENIVLALEDGSQSSEFQENVNTMFRAFHSVKGNIAMVGYSNCSRFAHRAEDIVSLIRDHKLSLDANVSNILLKSIDQLNLFFSEILEKGSDEETDASKLLQDLEQLEKSVTGSNSDVKVPEKAEDIIDKRQQEAFKVLTDEEKSETKKLRILIAEDNFTSRLILQKMMSRFGCEVFSVASGEEAVQAYETYLNLSTPYDLICLDYHLPGISGQEVLKKIREIEGENEIKPSLRSKIVIITSDGDPKKVLTSYKELCDDYIFKPFDLSQIEKSLKKLKLV